LDATAFVWFALTLLYNPWISSFLLKNQLEHISSSRNVIADSVHPLNDISYIHASIVFGICRIWFCLKGFPCRETPDE
jgi:hypothetical protein